MALAGRVSQCLFNELHVTCPERFFFFFKKKKKKKKWELRDGRVRTLCVRMVGEGVVTAV